MSGIARRRRWAVVIGDAGGWAGAEYIDPDEWVIGTCWTRQGAERARRGIDRVARIVRVEEWEAERGPLLTRRAMESPSL